MTHHPSSARIGHIDDSEKPIRNFPSGLTKKAVAATGIGLLIYVSPFGATATAAPATSVIQSSQIELSTQSNGENTGKLQVSSLITSPETIALSPTVYDEGCLVTSSTATTTPAQQISYSFTLSIGCEVPQSGKNLLLEVGDQDFSIVAKPDAAGPLQWASLYGWFGLSAIASIILLLATYLYWAIPRYSAGLAYSIWTELLGLGPTWSFKDSWASIITLVTAAFSGVLGSEAIVKAITGSKDTSDSLGEITVGSAIALGLVGSSPLILLALRSRRGNNTVIGLLAASLLTLTATVGQLGVILQGASGYGVPTGLLFAAGIFSGSVLAVYACRSTLVSLDQVAAKEAPKDSGKVTVNILTSAQNDGPAQDPAPTTVLLRPRDKSDFSPLL